MDTVYQAINALYDGPNGNEIEKASLWLADVQKSIHSWKIADELLQQKKDFNSCYFAAQTMRAKIQHNLSELPAESHVPLRDTLIAHLERTTPDTTSSILTQLSLALADLALQMPSWQDCISDLIKLFSNKEYLLLEILTLLPQEIDSSNLKLGENRREDIKSQLRLNSQTVMLFLKQCLNNSQGSTNVGLKSIKCMTSWLQVRAVNLHEIPQNTVIGYSLQVLRDHNSINTLHDASSDCICALLQCLEEVNDHENIDRLLFDSVVALEESYHLAVAHEEEEKVSNYARVFTELAESFLMKIIDCTDNGNSHFAMKSLELALVCVGYHDYEVAEITFNLWYRLSEEVYRRDHQPLTDAFKPHIERLIEALARHCQCEPDLTQLPDETDDFYEFRQKVMSLIKDVVFIVGSSSVFRQMFAALQSNISWEQTEAALFVMQSVARNILPDEYEYVPKVVEAILSMPSSSHLGVRATCILLLGELADWVERHAASCLAPCVAMLLAALPQPRLALPAATALQNICKACPGGAAEHIGKLLGAVQALDQLAAPPPAAAALMRAVAPVVASLPPDQMSAALCEASAPQLEGLRRLCSARQPIKRGTTSDPVLYLDRLAALYRDLTLSADLKNVAASETHPCLPALTEAWPVLIDVMDKFGGEERVMERVCRAARFGVRAARGAGAALLPALCGALAQLYPRHAHSCVLYLCSVLVDELAARPGCAAALAGLLADLLPPAFALLQRDHGFRDHPDTVDDLFRLFIRFLQRMPVQLLSCGVMGSILQCACSAAALDHRDASASLMNFLADFARLANTAHPDTAEAQHAKALAEELVVTYGGALTAAVLEASVLHLHRGLVPGAADVLLELARAERRHGAAWLGAAVRQLPARHTAAATLLQAQHFHNTARSTEKSKEMTKLLRDFAKLYR